TGGDAAPAADRRDTPPTGDPVGSRAAAIGNPALSRCRAVASPDRGRGGGDDRRRGGAGGQLVRPDADAALHVCPDAGGAAGAIALSGAAEPPGAAADAAGG